MTAPRRYAPNRARAAAIRQAREWACMSQYDLARALGVSQRTVCRWEAAAWDPGPVVVMRIAEVTRVRVSFLLVPGGRTSRDEFGWPSHREAAA